ncbi:hypothetical protein TNCV_432241 [Trichonephila clavipes]|nr:hypothetical protein TNCV_432241 [Trichonephila clavipes]
MAISTSLYYCLRNGHEESQECLVDPTTKRKTEQLKHSLSCLNLHLAPSPLLHPLTECLTTKLTNLQGVLNYGQKSSVRSDSGATWTTTSLRLENSWHAMHHPKATYIREMRSSLEGTSFSYTIKKQLTH